MVETIVTNCRTWGETGIENTGERDKEKIIHGLMFEPWSDAVTEFKGVFSYSRGQDYNAIEGLLEDYYGHSRIKGLLDLKKSLSFDKIYDRRPPIAYKFEFDENRGLYIGGWKGDDAFEGHSVCKLENYLTQLEADFAVEYFKSFDSMTDEERSQDILGYMIGRGDLDISRHPETGELMFGLSEQGKRLAKEADRILSPEEKEDIRRAIDSVDDNKGAPF